MKIVSARRFGIWTKLFQRWIKREIGKVTTAIFSARTSIEYTLSSISGAIASLRGNNPDATITGVYVKMEEVTAPAKDEEIYAMFPGAVDENGNINGYWTINEDGYLVADFTMNNGVLTFNN